MLFNEKLIFLQLQKTGGTHIESILRELIPDIQQHGKHFRIPRSFALQGRSVLGCVRNPWDWYLSYWTYSCQKIGGPYHRCCRKRSIRKALANERAQNANGELNRKPAELANIALHELSRPVGRWTYLYDDPNDPERFREWLQLVMSTSRRYDLFQDYGICRKTHEIGLYTYLYLFLFSAELSPLYTGFSHMERGTEKYPQFELVDHLSIRVERLEADLIKALTTAGIALSPAQKQLILQKRKTNTSRRSLSRDDYYDARCRGLVAKMDAFLIEKYDYCW